ncbi:nuclear transport factor 2 family protein [Nocardia thailandica]|uniref:nuclear transport factor 2 family protein n=1 Tax=Nocardia thailandica TaxID=257275 RepID=UPI0002F01B44|nr:nuclear transport factor 2 family protein [Nocardia thailandica]
MTEPTGDDATLLRRVQALEDRWQILELLASYGPAVDSGSADTAARVWTEDGVYDVDTGALHGRDALRAMVRGDAHQHFIGNGSAHLLGLPHVVVDGDRAVAVGHSQLVLKEPGTAAEFTVARITANRWELVRTEAGWKVERRTARLLDGRPEARALLGGDEARG